MSACTHTGVRSHNKSNEYELCQRGWKTLKNYISRIIRNSSTCKTSNTHFAKTHLKTLNICLWIWGGGKTAEYRVKGNIKEKLGTDRS